MPDDAPPEYPSPAIVSSRRLMGPNRFGDREGAVLEVALDPGAPARADALLAEWPRQASALAGALGWAPATPTVHRVPEGASCFLAAPVDQLLTGTEVAEQAWVVSEAAVDAPATAAAAVEAARARVDAARAQEANAAFVALHAAALARGVLVTFDDDTLTLGGGAGAISWPLGALPAVDDVPWGAITNVPVALITGSNGKTTTARLLAALLTGAGHVTGMSSTDGVEVGGALVDAGDYSGPVGARLVLRDPRVTAAVLETARGGILRRGLAVHHADAAAVTNVSSDHFGEYGVHDVADLARVKLTVARALDRGGPLVLNADDPTLRAAGATVGASVCWTTLDGLDPMVAAHTRAGGDACVLLDDVVLLHHHGRWVEVLPVAELPLALGGAARHNVANVCTAVALAAALGVRVEAMRPVLRRFGLRPQDNRGRLTRIDVGGITAIVDYAHNPAAVQALAGAVAGLRAARRGIIIGTGGNREDDTLRALARAAAEALPFDRIVAKDMPRYRRGRDVGEVPAILADALRAAGVPEPAIGTALSDIDAVRDLLAWARPGDLLLLGVHAERDAVLALLDRLAREGWQAGQPLPPAPD